MFTYSKEKEEGIDSINNSARGLNDRGRTVDEMWARIQCSKWWQVVEAVGALNQSKWGRKTWITTGASSAFTGV